MRELLDTVVIGGGQAGLAAGYYLQRAHLSFAVLEAASQPGGSWPQYYDSLELFSPARYSSLPGLRFPGEPDRHPSRDTVVAYLREYANHFALPLLTGVRILRVQRAAGEFIAHAADGSSFRSRAMIAATGSFHTPHLPHLPGQDGFHGQILHSSDYRHPAAFAGQRVIVVGSANSAVQIAVELARVARVTLASRAPVRFLPQRLLGRDFHWWLKWTGLDHAPWFRDQSTPVLDAGKYRAALAAGHPARHPMFERFTETGVAWTGSESEHIDVVIFATGFRPNFPYLADLGALEAGGRPLQRRGISSVVPGLYFAGLSGQTNFRSATLRGVGPDAARVVKALRRFLGFTMPGRRNPR